MIRREQVSTAPVSSIRTPRNALSPVSGHMAQPALEAAEVGVFEYDLATGEQRFSPLCLKICGLEEGETPSLERLEGLMHPEDRHLARHAVDSLSPSGPGEF